MTNYTKTMREALEEMYISEDNVGILRDIVKRKSAMPLKFSDGKMKVDLFTASAVTQALDKVNPANKAKLTKMINMGKKANFMSIAKVVFKSENDPEIEKENEGFASDAQRRAAFASGYKEKGKKKKEEAELDEKKIVLAKGMGREVVNIDGEIKLMKGGKVISTGDYDRGAGKFFMNVKGEKGQVAFSDPKDILKINEEADLDEGRMKELMLTIHDKLKKEGGAAGFDDLKKAAKEMSVKLTPDMLKGMPKVKQHRNGDYILEEADLDEKLISARGKDVAKKMMKSKTMKPFAKEVAKMQTVTPDKLERMLPDYVASKDIQSMFEEVELEEAVAYKFAAVDPKNLVIGMASKESDAKDMARRYKGAAHIIKLKKSLSPKKGDMMINRPLIDVQRAALKEETELDEAMLIGRDYEYDEKEGVVKISKKNFRKVKKDSKGTIDQKNNPTMMVLTKKGTSLVPVKFTEEVEESYEFGTDEYAKHTKDITPGQGKEVDEASARRDAMRAMGKRRGVDPADKDDVATDDDRKAADKNILMQLRKATNLGGKYEVEFKDKKKQKVSPAIAMAFIKKYEKMKPVDKAKLQDKASKSYRDLLKALKEEDTSMLGRIERKLKEIKNG